MRKLAVVMLLAFAAVVVTTLPSHADPNIGDVPPHRHYVETATGERVEVGPQVCDNPALQKAFNQFHVNIHRVEDGIGPVAPGLHNNRGADLAVSGC